MRVELMAAESSSNRGKKDSAASGLLNSPTRPNDDVEDPVKSPPHSPNNSSTRKACYAVLQSWVSKKFMTGWSLMVSSALYMRGLALKYLALDSSHQ
ncbi:protein LIKE COV 2-like [Salvia splendens]|uniref:protein LIKE COV 2-like n=1 Tax=Salvia splendens TaxID=180675 RepID=UPI001C274BBE|nr:protein LIKE COV 2-like [Salvia splendens]